MAKHMYIFDRWLREQLEIRHWTQAELCRATGLESSVISNLINGKRKAGPRTARAIAHAFHMTEMEVFVAADIYKGSATRGGLKDVIIQAITIELEDLSEEDKEEVLENIRTKKRIKAQRSKKVENTKANAQKTTPAGTGSK